MLVLEVVSHSTLRAAKRSDQWGIFHDYLLRRGTWVYLHRTSRLTAGSLALSVTSVLFMVPPLIASVYPTPPPAPLLFAGLHARQNRLVRATPGSRHEHRDERNQARSGNGRYAAGRDRVKPVIPRNCRANT
jgi:hypothetical protein